MLILGRKEGEEILLGSEITVKIVEVSKGVVKVGIEAPKSLVILRGELKERIKASNQEANAKVGEQELKDLSRLLQK
ncbi:MAG: carbon storage regulator CsrA [Epsilonproteobacteria bacterium]|nr:carbon storage regulator CsrA [Campylobacterota bacterium]